MTREKKTRVAPGIWQLKKDKFSIRVRVQHPRTGKWFGWWRTFEGSRAEALRARETWREELLAELDGTANRRETVGDFATSWLAMKLDRGDLQPSTAERYAQSLDLHILPEFGTVYLDRLAGRDIESWLARKAPSFAPRTCNSWLRVMRTLLGDAVRLGIIAANPAAQVRALRERGGDEESNALTIAEFGRYLDAWKRLHPRFHPLVLVLALTGCRWGEATALKWVDVEQAEQSGVLRVSRSHWRGRVKETKTGKVRLVPFPKVLVEALRDHRRRLLAEQNPGLEAGWVFPASNGKLPANGRLADENREVLAAAAIDHRVTIHGLRRTMTDLLRQAQVDWVTAAAVIGHDADRMRQHYSTVRADEAREAGERVLELVTLAPQ